MAPSLPFPTDNIYKFACLFGLALIIASILAFASTYSAALDRKVKLAEVTLALESKDVKSKADEALIKLNTRLIDVEKSNENTVTSFVTGASQQKADQTAADTATQQAEQQQAEQQQQQDAQAKAFTGKPQFDDPLKWWQALNGNGQTALVEKLDGKERQTALELMATARDPRTSDPIREKAAGMLYGIAQNIGLPGTVAPVSPLALPAPTKDTAPVSGLLPSPDTPRSGTLIAGKDGVRQQTYGDLDTTANRAIGEATTSLGNPNPQPAQTIRNAEPTSDVSTKVQPGPLEGEYIRGRQTAEQYFPFKNAQQAEARAMTATKEFGEEYGVEPHPSVKGAFAVVPASKAQSNTTSPSVTSAKSGKENNNQLSSETPIAKGLERKNAETRIIAESAYFA